MKAKKRKLIADDILEGNFFFIAHHSQGYGRSIGQVGESAQIRKGSYRNAVGAENEIPLPQSQFLHQASGAQGFAQSAAHAAATARRSPSGTTAPTAGVTSSGSAVAS